MGGAEGGVRNICLLFVWEGCGGGVLTPPLFSFLVW